jgi:hypothetical protein
MHYMLFKIVGFPFLVTYKISLDFVVKVADTEQTRFEGQTKRNLIRPLTISFNLGIF